MSRRISVPAALALVAAFAALIIAWTLPLPRLVLGEEEKAGARIPQDRTAVAAATTTFAQAESSYKQYIQSHDVGPAIASLSGAVQRAQANASKSDPASITGAGTPVLDYLAQLTSYAAAGEAYFTELSHYDDELMAWTRSLGSDSEALRPDTWPIVEYLKLYPPPTGETGSYASIRSSEIESTTTDLQQHLSIATASEPSPDTGALTAVTQDLEKVREAGRSIEYVESLHANYLKLLSDYDTKTQAVAAGSNNTGLSTGRLAFAIVLDVLLGGVTALGLAALFLPAIRPKSKAAG